MKKLSARIAKRKSGESSRQSILRALKLRGSMSTAELAKFAGITYTGVRRQLSALQHEGLVEYKSRNDGAGRPVHQYKLTPLAVSQFPSGYEGMAADLLDTIFSAQGHVGVMEFLRLNNERLFRNVFVRVDGKPLAERVAEVARYYRENGYMTEWSKLPDGNFFLYHQNCAIYKLAVRYRQLCIVEPRLMEMLLGVKVSRQQYILKDQPVCGYLVDATRPLI